MTAGSMAKMNVKQITNSQYAWASSTVLASGQNMIYCVRLCTIQVEWSCILIDYDALPKERQAMLTRILSENGRVVCTEAARLLGVSEHTVRRDLKELARQGICKKVYGGAVSQLKQSAPFETRMSQSIQEKLDVARRSAALIHPGSCVFIDAGSTYLAMVDFIPLDIDLTIVTNSPHIAAALSGRARCELILLGGKVNPDTGSVLGSEPVNQIRNIIFDQAFIGVCGLDSQAGLTAVYFEDACLKKEVMAQSSEVVAAVIADKLPQVARYKVSAWEDIDILVVSKATHIETFSGTTLRIEVA